MRESHSGESQQEEARQDPSRTVQSKAHSPQTRFRLRSRLTALAVERQRSNGLLLAGCTGAWLLALCHHLLHVPLCVELVVRGGRILRWRAR